MNVSDKKAENATSWEERPSRAGEEEELACDDMASGDKRVNVGKKLPSQREVILAWCRL